MSVHAFDADGVSCGENRVVEILPESRMPVVMMLSLYCVARWSEVFGTAVVGLKGYGSRHYFHMGFQAGVVLLNEYNDAIRHFVIGYMPRVGFASLEDSDLIPVRPHGDGYLVSSLLHDEEACLQVADRVRKGFKLEAFEPSYDTDSLFARISGMAGIPVPAFSMTADCKTAEIFGDKLNARIRASEKGYSDVYCSWRKLEVKDLSLRRARGIRMSLYELGWEKAVLKVPNAASGIGQMVIQRDKSDTLILNFLRKNPGPVFIEEFFGEHLPISVTFTLVDGKIYFKHVTTQIQSSDGLGNYQIHEGNLIAGNLADLLPENWPEDLRRRAHEMLMTLCARVLQDMQDAGYIGALSMDLMIRLDENGCPVIKLAEINARVTGSMPVSGTARLAERHRDGRETFVMGMNASFETGKYRDWRCLESALSDLHYSPERGKGVLICMGATLKDDKCSLHVVADSPAECRQIMRLIRRRIGAKVIEVQGFEADPGSVVAT